MRVKFLNTEKSLCCCAMIKGVKGNLNHFLTQSKILICESYVDKIRTIISVIINYNI